MSSTSATATGGGQSTVGTSTSSFNLFPTQTQGQNQNQDQTRGTPNVYYLVFLGVLVILMLIAGCLTLRAVRMRRRYRTATQIALSRGEPIPEGMREDFWGLGGLSGWTAEGLDRLGAIRPGEEWVGAGRRGGKGRWEKVPVLYEGQLFKEPAVEKQVSEDHGDEPWNTLRPLTLVSLRPSQTPFPEEPVEPPALTPVRNMGPRPRPPPMFNFSRHRPPSTADQAIASTSRAQPLREEDREVVPGEDVRLGIIIQMPTEGMSEDQRTRRADDDDDEVAWESGMELGIWEGVVGGQGAEIHPGYISQRGDRGKTSIDSVETE
ncbi:hypothetical protein IAR55_006712 [Kwoniella newhampshirensis]|uniref:Uncharacterized protein n=1 Tax=Kwoniella newhampshirensis TaxID=1651941 RepID=A0AAW0YGB2_9TREE